MIYKDVCFGKEMKSTKPYLLDRHASAVRPIPPFVGEGQGEGGRNPPSSPPAIGHFSSRSSCSSWCTNYSHHEVGTRRARRRCAEGLRMECRFHHGRSAAARGSSFWMWWTYQACSRRRRTHSRPIRPVPNIRSVPGRGMTVRPISWIVPERVKCGPPKTSPARCSQARSA